MKTVSAVTGRYRNLARLATLLLVAAVWLCTHFGLFTWLDLVMYDTHFKIRGTRPTSGHIVLVYMDDKSAVRLGRRHGGWSRLDMAAALNNLSRAGSEIIALDVIFSAPSVDPRHDKILADTIYDCNNVVLARISSVASLGSVEPIAPFQEGMIGTGFIDLPLDQDGCLRKIHFFNAHRLDNGALQLLPAFALEVARTYRNLDYSFDFSHSNYFTLGSPEQKQLRLPYPDLLINYYGDHHVFTRLSYADVVNGNFDPAAVRGKIVMIGSTLKTEKDFFTTPFTHYRTVESPFADRFAASISNVQDADDPGLSCHAQAIETILNQDFIVPLAAWQQLALLIVCAILGHLLFFRFTGTVPALLSAGGLLLVVLLSSQLAMQAGLWIRSPELLAMILAQIGASMILLKFYEKSRNDWVTSAFGKYLSRTVVEQLVKGDINLNMEGKHQQLTILFADIRAFTTLAESMSAQQVTRLLNRYFAAMVPCIQAQQGTVDKLIGDAIMAFFGAPVPSSKHPQQAAQAALHMLETLRQLRDNSDIEQLRQLEIGIGINSGEVTVGNLGCEQFMNYTVIGDAVNLASRVEGLNKIYGCHILLTDNTAEHLDDSLVLREVDQVVVKGKESATTLYELVGYSATLEPQRKEALELFAAALRRYRRRHWQQALLDFEQVLQLLPDDGPARLYTTRCHELIRQPPPQNWDAITRFSSK